MACVKEFEITVGLSDTLLRRHLRPLFSSDRQVDSLTHKAVFRHAAKRGLISTRQCERWSSYWDLRNDPSHRRVENFAKATLHWLPQFIDDARDLIEVMSQEIDS